MELETVIQISNAPSTPSCSSSTPEGKGNNIAMVIGGTPGGGGGGSGGGVRLFADESSSTSASTTSISRSSSEGSFRSDNTSCASSVSEYELVSRISSIPNLSVNVRKFASQHWNDCQFVYSSLKHEYQVKNVPIAHWGIKDVLIIGACPVPRKVTQYPVSNKIFVQDQTRAMLSRLIKEHKVTAFMSLMAECDDENGNESSIYRPYSKLDLPVIDPTVKFFKLGIKDCNVTDDNSVLGFARLVVELLKLGEKIYLHCWGGHGRAGTVYCLVLHLIYGMTADDALDHCQRIHDCRESFITVGSPQTLIQANQVRRIIESLPVEAEENSEVLDL
jgi:hypothetical protein